MPLEDLPGVTEIPAKCRRFTGGIDCSDKQKWQISVQQQLTSENAQLGLGSFREYANARNLLDRLRKAGFGAELQQGDGLTRVIIPGLDAGAAAQVQQRRRERGFPDGLQRVANR